MQHMNTLVYAYTVNKRPSFKERQASNSDPCIHMDCILLSPGAIGFSIGNNLKICNFQESYLECHLTTCYNITRIGHCGHCLFKIATITISWLLPYPKNAVFFCHNFGMYTHVFQNKKHDRIIKFNITHNPAGENPIWLPLQITYYYRH